MVELNQVYKCSVCGNIVQVVHASIGTLVCCEKPMELLVPKDADAGLEKHVPVIEAKGDGILVKVGDVPHPMEEKHWIEWIEVLLNGGGSFRKFLKPGMAPEAEFPVKPAEVLVAREFCNIHGLWKSKSRA